jgi:hypothetical protein
VSTVWGQAYFSSTTPVETTLLGPGVWTDMQGGTVSGGGNDTDWEAVLESGVMVLRYKSSASALLERMRLTGFASNHPANLQQLAFRHVLVRGAGTYLLDSCLGSFDETSGEGIFWDSYVHNVLPGDAFKIQVQDNGSVKPRIYSAKMDAEGQIIL